jgi:hypothetical protein
MDNQRTTITLHVFMGGTASSFAGKTTLVEMFGVWCSARHVVEVRDDAAGGTLCYLPNGSAEPLPRGPGHLKFLFDGVYFAMPHFQHHVLT